MKKVAFLLVVVGFALCCTFPEQYKETSTATIEDSSSRVLNMSDDEFLQHAKKQDPAFRETVEKIDEKAQKKEEILKIQENQDEELRHLVESETTKKAVLINQMSDLEDVDEMAEEESSALAEQ